MRKKDKPSGHELSGKISDRIRKGEIDARNDDFRSSNPPPSAKSVRNAEGHGLGNGANRSKDA